MPAIRKCRGCGADVPLNAPFGHCPKCLLDLGFGPLPDEGTSKSQPVSDRIFGDYELLQQIGRGGMGIVYKARQVALNRSVALKMIRAGEYASPLLIQRFHREAEATANLQHPNIVPIYETGEIHGQHYLSMALIEGGSLDDYIARGVANGASPGKDARSAWRARMEDVARIIAKVARAVDHAHQHGVLHRDLKPSNIIVDQRGEPHLTDFGLAKVLGRSDSNLTVTGAIMGTPSFMAPEQAAGKNKSVTTAADVYSLGAILYAMLTGHPPFRADTPVETLRQVVEQEPKHPSTLREGIDSDLSTIAMKCLEKEPQRRYSSAVALAEDLERWLRKEPIMAQPIGVAGRLRRWCRREPALAGLIGGMVLSLAAVTVVSLLAFQNANVAADAADRSRKETDVQNRRLQKLNEQLVAAKLSDLNQFYQNPTQTVVRISSEDLGGLTGRPPIESSAAQPSVRLVFGVYTHTPPAGMFTRFAPILSYLETNVTEFRLQTDLVIYKGYSNLVSAMISGEVHLARPGPATYIQAHRERSSLLVMVKQLHDHQPIIDGVIFTRPDTGISGLADLRGNSIAFGDRDSTFGNYAPKEVLLEIGLRAGDIRWGHCTDHRDVVQQVLAGAFQAGAANSNVVAQAMGEGADLRIIHVMHSVSFPWVASASVPPPVVNAITRSLLALKDPAILGRIDSDLTGFAPARKEEYDAFEKQMDKAAEFEAP